MRSRFARPSPELVGAIATPAPPPPAKSVEGIRVELASAIGGWPARSRFDVVLRGNIISAAPADTMSIRDRAGVELAAIQFGQADQPEPVTLPGGDLAFRTAFQVYLPMPGGDAISIADMRLSARSRDGAVFEAGMRLGCAADRAEIIAGPVRDLPVDTPVADIPVPCGILYLESASISPEGLLLVAGWTIGASRLVEVQILVDGKRVGAASLGLDRGDVADAYPGYPNARHSGFTLRKPLGYTIRGANVTAQVLALSGACFASTIPLHHAIVPPAEAVSAGSPASDSVDQAAMGAPSLMVVVCDRAIVTKAGELLVEGWAFDRNGIESVAIEVDGRPEGLADHGLERADVAAEYQDLPANTGFRFQRTMADLAGTSHDIRITAVSRAGDRKDLTVSVAPPPASAFLFELDNPKTRDGVMVHPISGRLVIEGWTLARDGIAGIDVRLDGTMLGQAHHGMARPDVGVAFPEWTGAARAGYTFHCPSRALPDGDHLIEVVARSKSGGTHVHAFRITVRKTDDPEEAASIRRRIKRVERDTVAGVLRQLNWQPSYHLIVAGPPPGALMRDSAAAEKAWALTIRSIIEQSWPDWRATLLASGGPDARAARSSVKAVAREHASRFTVTDPSDVAAWGAPLGAARGAPLGGARGTPLAETNDPSLIALLARGDELGRDALGCFAVASGIHARADCLYADEFRTVPGTTRPDAFFKPDFSPALLLSMNYIGRPLVLRPVLLAATGATARSLTRDGFFDLALRCAEAASAIHHVPELLSRTDGGVATNPENGAAALRSAMNRRGIAAEVLPGVAPETWHARRTTQTEGKVSIVIPTCAAKRYIETCLKTLRAVTAYKNYEIVCVDNIPETDAVAKTFVREHADKVVEMAAPFNWSRFNNAAAAVTESEYLLFLNDDIEIVEPGWLDAMLEALVWPGAGIAGARLLYPNRTVQHAGMFLGDGIGRHAFRHTDEGDPGYFGLALTPRDVIAVTGACMLVRRDVFEQLGRFDEAHDVVNNDLDFCLRAHRAGLRSIYTPHATLIHHELSSRDHLPDDFDTTRFTSAWRGQFASGDPYFNPHLSRYADDYRIDDEGVRVMYSGHPLIDRESVKAILVVKVDHIGDFITSLPAIRRLKAVFPGARLTALVAPASAAIASIEPAIDESISLEFFHARSELGETEMTEIELGALEERLAAYRFDIAVDLRKHLSTRHLLLRSGARLLAGYDMLENFPWLDVVLEWDGDKALQRKRSHIVDDLVNLVAAIDAACEPGRRLFEVAPKPMPPEEMPDHARHLFGRPVVAIHPGSGNVMRQWPEKHIPPLIDLLIERNDVAVLLVGGSDDEEKAAAIVAKVARPDRVASVAGQIALKDLPRLLTACALFIGGNSGPKHIAAASGVPTIGIHSGVVDPGEWGPMGERAVALYRDMSCAPCFLAKPEHCPRGLACVDMLDPALVHQMAQMFLARPANDRIEPVRPIPRLLPAVAVTPKQPKKRLPREKVAASR